MKYALPFLFLIACRTVPPSTSTNTFDSTMVKSVARVDTIWLAGEVVEVPIQIECDSTTNLPKAFTNEKAAKRIDLKTSINKKGLLTVKCTCDSLATVVTLQDREIFRLKHEQKTIVIPPTVSHDPWWFDVLFRWWALITGLWLLWKNRVKLLGMLTHLPIGK